METVVSIKNQVILKNSVEESVHFHIEYMGILFEVTVWIAPVFR